MFTNPHASLDILIHNEHLINMPEEKKKCLIECFSIHIVEDNALGFQNNLLAVKLLLNNKWLHLKPQFICIVRIFCKGLVVADLILKNTSIYLISIILPGWWRIHNKTKQFTLLCQINIYLFN